MFWCEECYEKNDEEEYEDECYESEMMLPICNSPRMGVCGYDSSRVYPDQFEPDKE